MKDFKVGDKVTLLSIEANSEWEKKLIGLDSLEKDVEYEISQVYYDPFHGDNISFVGKFYRHPEDLFTRVDHFTNAIHVDVKAVISIHPPHTVESFEELLLEWVDSHDWSFGGGCKELVEEDSE